MKTLIIFATHHGCAEKCATILSGHLGGDVALVKMKDAARIRLEDYGAVIVGGSIHAGKIQKSVQEFCRTNLDALRTKRLGLFICAMEEGEKADQEFAAAFPDALTAAAMAKGIFGGEFDFNKMNFFERAIIKKIAKVASNVSKIKEQNILEFARAMARSPKE